MLGARSVVAAILLQVVASAAISLTPGSGSSGTAITVAGQGFVPGDRVRVFWDGANLGGNTQIEADGTFIYQATVPTGAAAGIHTVEARSRQGGSAYATFEIVAPATTTTTSPPTTSTLATLPTTTTVATAVRPPVTATSQSTSITTGTTAATPTIPGGIETTSVPVGTTSTTSTTRADEAGGGGGVVGGIAAALTAAAMVGGLLMLLSRTKRPTPGLETTDSGGAAVMVADEPTLPPPAVAIRLAGWERGVLDLPGDGKLERLVGLDRELLAVGQAAHPDRETAAVWVSENGGSWQLLEELGTGTATFGMPWRDGVLVLGLTEESTGSVGWVWRGDERGWRRLSDPADPVLAGLVFDGAAALDGAVVAYGRGLDRSGAWVTEDGAWWQRARLRGSVDLVAAVPGMLLAFGREPVERRATVARSTDGFSWEELTEDASFVFEGAAIAAAIGFEGGVVAAGADKMRGTAAVWVSDDGERWLRTPFQEEVGTSIQHLAPVGNHLLAVGADMGPRRTGRVGATVVWESTDGVSWHRLEGSDLFANAIVTSIGGTGEALIMAGRLLSGPGSPWTRPVPVTWIHHAASDLQRSFEPTGASLTIWRAAG